MANTNTAAEIAEAIGAAEAAEAAEGGFEISEIFANELRRRLLEIVSCYDKTYYPDDSFHPFLKGDTLIGGITLKDEDIDVDGPHDDEAVCTDNHRLKNGRWVEDRWCSSVPSESIRDHLISFREFVRRQIDKEVVFDTPNDGLTWSFTIYEDGRARSTYELGSIGAEGLNFHTWEKVDPRWN